MVAQPQAPAGPRAAATRTRAGNSGQTLVDPENMQQPSVDTKQQTHRCTLYALIACATANSMHFAVYGLERPVLGAVCEIWENYQIRWRF